MRRLTSIISCAAFLCWLACPSAWADTLLLEYDLAGPSLEINPWREATTAPEGIVPGLLTRGPGPSPANLANGFSATQWNNLDDHAPPLEPSRDNALLTGDYFEFSFTVETGHTVSLSTLDVSLRRSGAGAPENFEWQYSLDGFASPGVPLINFQYFGRANGTAPGSFDPFAYMEEDLPGQNGGNPMPTLELGQTSILQNLSSGTTVTFRLLAWGADRNSRTLALGRFSGPSLRGRIAEDTVIIPEFAISPRLGKVSGGGEGALRLVWNTRPGMAYELWDSPDLAHWSLVEDFPREAVQEKMDHVFAPKESRRFFRIREFLPEQTVPEREVFFSLAGPTGQEEDLTLEDKIIELLDLAPSGSLVYGALYTWSRSRMAEAFIEAHERGVEVRLIIGSDFSAVQTLRQTLPPGRVLICPNALGLAGSCHGTGINHNKFFLFSHLSDGSLDVVVQSSANFTNTQITNNNNMVILRGDGQLYDAYLAYWHDLAREQTDLEYYWTAESESGNKVYFFPRNTGPDPVVEILDQLVPGPESEIHIAMAFWSNPRVAIAEKLVELRDAGFAVRVLVNPNNAGSLVLSTLEGAGIPVIRYPPVHSKYMLIDHNIGRLRERLVYTGSHNFTGPALRSNDETILRLVDLELYEAFMEDWRHMSEHPLAR